MIGDEVVEGLCGESERHGVGVRSH